MSSLVLSGDTSGTVSLSVPAVAGSNTLTIQAATATNSVNTLGTAVASTSGTSIDFTSIPSWVKRVTVMFNGVSTSGASFVQVQLGAGSVTTSGYVCGASLVFGTNSCTASTATSGFIFSANSAADARSGHIILTNISSNIWIASGTVAAYSGDGIATTAGNISLGGTLDRVRITTVNGTDTFDAGSVNILYEG